MLSRPSGRWSLAGLCLVLLPAIILFCIGALTDITLPGVYMDAVNPDYAVVQVLNPASSIQTWFLPGTLLFGKWPIIGQVYHGALPFYLGLPSYAVFGTGVTGIRVTNALFGCLVILAAGLLLRAFGVRVLVASLCLMLLALDPGFLFSFRTQFYITLLPIALVFASATVVEVWRDRPSGGIVFLAGLLAGLACYGYFIFGFLAPALALLALYRWRERKRLVLSCWPGGLCLGLAPYLLGAVAMLIATGGWHEFVAFTKGNLQSLHVQGPSLSLLQRAEFFYYLLRGTILNVGTSQMMLHETVPLALPIWKLLLLLLIPGLVTLGSLTRRGLARLDRAVGLLFCAGLVLCFFGLVLIFGRRLWFHHAALLIPVLYMALAMSLELILCRIPAALATMAAIVCAVILVPFLVANASDRQAVFRRLEKTGGVGLASDAIDHFAKDASRIRTPTHVYFPDWGLFMQFAMLTRGTIPYTTSFSPDMAKATLCSGWDAEVVTVAANGDNRLAQWNKVLAWPSTTAIYRQRDGVPVLYATRWTAADRPAGACSADAANGQAKTTAP